MSEQTTYYIYVLIDPRDGRIRYVGKTYRLNKRYKDHCSKQYGKNHRTNWLGLLFSLTIQPIMEVIEECDGSTWADRETFWIRYYRGAGCDLVNASDGGEGAGIGHSNGKGKKRKPYSEKHRENIRKAKMGKPCPWAVGNTYGAVNKGKKHTTQHTENISNGLKNSEKLRVSLLDNTRAAKLTEPEVLLIRGLLGEGLTNPTLSSMFNISEQSVCDMRHGRTWKRLLR